MVSLWRKALKEQQNPSSVLRNSKIDPQSSGLPCHQHSFIKSEQLGMTWNINKSQLLRVRVRDKACVPCFTSKRASVMSFGVIHCDITSMSLWEALMSRFLNLTTNSNRFCKSSNEVKSTASFHLQKKRKNEKIQTKYVFPYFPIHMRTETDGNYRFFYRELVVLRESHK